MHFDSAMELMHFICDNCDNNNWFTTDIIQADSDEWKVIREQLMYLTQHGYIRRETAHMYVVLARPTL